MINHIIGALSLDVGIIEVILSIYFWTHTYKKVGKLDKMLNEILNIDIFKEGSLVTINNLINECLDKNPELEGLHFTHDHEDGKISKYNLIAALFNMNVYLRKNTNEGSNQK